MVLSFLFLNEVNNFNTNIKISSKIKISFLLFILIMYHGSVSKIYLYTTLNLKINLFFDKLFLFCGNEGRALKMVGRLINRMPLAI